MTKGEKDPGRGSYQVVYQDLPLESQFDIFFAGYLREEVGSIAVYKSPEIGPELVSLSHPMTRHMIAHVNAVVRARTGALATITPHNEQMAVGRFMFPSARLQLKTDETISAPITSISSHLACTCNCSGTRRRGRFEH